MKVLVDTSIWSLALRRNTPENEMSTVNVLRDLITDGRVVLMDAIRQEVLSGVRYQEQFARLRDYLRAFPDLEITLEDYELAAEFFNTCCRNEVQGSNTDFLICAVANNRSYTIFKIDKNFGKFQPYIPVNLY